MEKSIFNKVILLVDDEKNISDLIEEVLRQDGFENIVRAYDGKTALEMCERKKPDIVVLDVMLPDMDGIEVCRRMRIFTYCPIIFVSAKNDDIDKILGLSSGGDDYITKPFSPRELVFRIKAQLRRQQYNAESTKSQKERNVVVGNLAIDVEASCAYKAGKLLELTAREFGLLLYFMRNTNKIISKERLYEQVWGESGAICDNTIMVHIRHLREKIERNPSKPEVLVTVKGLGYKMVEGRD